MPKDLRGFLAEYERANPKEFCRIKKEVDPKYEVAAILTKLEETRKLPILFYEKVKGSDLPVVTNLYSTKKKIASSLGIDPQKFRDKYLEAVENQIPPEIVSDGPVMEETIGEHDVDLKTLPMMTYHEGDAAPYITAGMVLAEDPENLERILEEKKEKLKSLMPALKGLLNTSGTKPVIRYYEGQNGIKEVVYESDKYHQDDIWIASRRILDLAGVKYRQYKSTWAKD